MLIQKKYVDQLVYSISICLTLSNFHRVYRVYRVNHQSKRAAANPNPTLTNPPLLGLTNCTNPNPTLLGLTLSTSHRFKGSTDSNLMHTDTSSRL